MVINTTITETQAALLAYRFQVKQYANGNDLLAQCMDALVMMARKQGLVAAVSVSTSKNAIVAAITAWENATGVPIKVPGLP
jgi:hypothetical protein